MKNKKVKPFNYELPDWMADATKFDHVLGLNSNMGGGFESISNQFRGLGLDQPRTNKLKQRKKQFSIDREEMIQSGQEPLIPDERLNANNNRDFFGDPLHYG